MAKKQKKGNKITCKFQLEDFMSSIGNYETKNIAEESKNYSIIAGINKNVARHIPCSYDGLKPVARRALLIMYEDKSRAFQKVNKIAGDTMGKYHPHGEGSVEEVIGRMGQKWNNNVLYIDPSGNYGNENGDEPAAGRYIKGRLSKLGYKCFFEDYKYAALDRKTTYLGNTTEPEYLPAKYPVGLVNPQFSSIGYGTAANIAPYNFKEVCEATIKLLHDPNAEIKLIPDFPNGCEVVADKNLEEVNHNHGRGKVTVQASINIDHEDNVIYITSLPHKVGSKQVTKAIAELVLAKKLEGIVKMDDDTSPEAGIQISIKLDKNVNPEKMVETLMKKNVGLKSTFAVQIKFIEDYREKEYTPKEYLLNWLDFRREILQGMHNKRYVTLLSDQHMNDIKIFVFSEDNISKTAKIIKSSKDDDDSIEKLVKQYKSIHMSSMQAKTICNMRYKDFNKASYQKFLEERDRLKKDIAESEKIIRDSKLIDAIIEKELKEAIELFGTPRKSKIIYEKKSEKKVDSKKVILAISKDGFVKKIDGKVYSTVGKLGNTSSQEVIALKINNNKNIIVFDSNGKASKVPVYGIPEMTPEEGGLIMSRYFNVSGQVVSVMEEIDQLNHDEETYIVFVSKNGFAKKTAYKDFMTMKDLKTAMSLNKGDQLVTTVREVVSPRRACMDMVIFTNNGNGIRLSLDNIQKSSGSTKGKRVVKLGDDEEVVGVDVLIPHKDLLFYITSSGRAKVTETKYFPAMEKKDEPVNLLPLTGNDRLVSVVSVDKSDRIVVYRKLSEPEEILVGDIKPSMRVAKAEKIIKVPKGDTVVAIRVLSSK